MKVKLLIAVLALVISSHSLAANMSVKMAKNCRYPNGNFQAYSGAIQVDLVPADAAAQMTLDLLAKKAATTGGYVTFKVDGSILSDDTVIFPRIGEYRVIKFLVNIAQ
jgi:hypothetical protein